MRERPGLDNRLRARRLERGLSQRDLAERAGVTRQAISSIEAGAATASVAVALRLARALGCRVEDLFGLAEEPATVTAEPAAAGTACEPGTRVRLARLGGRLIAYPLVGSAAVRTCLHPADGVVTDTAADGVLRVRLCDGAGLAERTVVVAGCDPALALVAEAAGRLFPGTRVVWTAAGTAGAIASLAAGEVHVAGIHWHSEAGEAEPNLALARAALRGRPALLVNLAAWEQGWLVARGNPKGIRGAGDLARGDVRIANRERGASARHLLDRELTRAGVDPARVRGYRWELPGHLELAQAVASGWADAGVGSAPVARLFGLDFIPLALERFDLVVPVAHLKAAPVRDLLETLAHRAFRAELASLGGYDTGGTGRVLARTAS